jgi:hypothetical protein
MDLSINASCAAQPSAAPAREACSNHDDRLDACGGAVVDDTRDGGRRHGDDREVDAGWQSRAEAHAFSPATSLACVLTG